MIYVAKSFFYDHALFCAYVGIEMLNKALQKVSKSSISLRVRCSIVLFTGLPEADRASVYKLVMRRSYHDSKFEKVFIKGKFLLTSKSNDWEEVTISDLHSYTY